MRRGRSGRGASPLRRIRRRPKVRRRRVVFGAHLGSPSQIHDAAPRSVAQEGPRRPPEACPTRGGPEGAWVGIHRRMIVIRADRATGNAGTGSSVRARQRSGGFRRRGPPERLRVHRPDLGEVRLPRARQERQRTGAAPPCEGDQAVAGAVDALGAPVPGHRTRIADRCGGPPAHPFRRRYAKGGIRGIRTDGGGARRESAPDGGGASRTMTPLVGGRIPVQARAPLPVSPDAAGVRAACGSPPRPRSEGGRRRRPRR